MSHFPEQQACEERQAGEPAAALLSRVCITVKPSPNNPELYFIDFIALTQ